MMSVVELFKPRDLDPDATHQIDIDAEVEIEPPACLGVPVAGVVVDRGYTHPARTPLYRVIDDFNVEWTAIESEIESASE